MLGCSPGEFEPSVDSFIEFVHPDDRARVEAAGDQVHLPNPLQPDRLTAARGRLSGRGATSVGSPGAKPYNPRP